MKYYLAIDIGATSLRHIIGYKNENDEIILDEVYRFNNEVKTYKVKDFSHYIWDIDNLFNEIKNGIKIALKKYKNIESLAIDTWGVDYVLLKKDEAVYPCFSYRDNRTDRAVKEVNEIISFKNYYKITGTQYQFFNTIYQLYTDKLEGRLKNVTDFLMIPEYFNFMLTNKKIKEVTNASTTGLLDCITHEYSLDLINKLKLKKSLFKRKIKKPGYIVGNLTEDIQKEVGGNIKVVLCPSHDTASAVYGIKMENDCPYISSGTWSLLGIKTDKAITSNEARLANFSNELGPSYIRFQKNITGLWIIQNLAYEFNLEYSKMVDLAKESTFEEIFDVNDKRFSTLCSKTDLITAIFLERNIKIYAKKDIIRSTIKSLAYSYSLAVEELEKITQKKYEKIYIFGGGAKNDLLNEMTENYTNKKVVALKIEASSLGNIISQMEANNYERRN